MIIFSSALFFSFFLSDTTLEKLAHSQYLQSKITKVLEDNAISSKGIKSIKFNEFNSADINIEKAKISGLNDVVGFDINLKVDLIKSLLFMVVLLVKVKFAEHAIQIQCFC